MNLQVVLFQPIGGGAIALRVDDESTLGMGSDWNSDAFHHMAGFVQFYRRLCDRPHSKDESIHAESEREQSRATSVGCMAAFLDYMVCKKIISVDFYFVPLIEEN